MSKKNSMDGDVNVNNGAEVPKMAEIQISEKQQKAAIPNETTASEKAHPVKQFTSEFSVTGMSFISNGKCITQLFWSILLTICLVLTIAQIYKQAVHYYETPILTNIEVKYEDSLPFPAIAICHSLPIRLSSFPRDEQFFAKLDKKTLSKLDEETRQLFHRLKEAYVNMTAEEFRRHRMHRIEDILLSCTLPDGTNCNHTDFRLVSTDSMAVCYGFNIDVKSPLIAKSAGQASGITMVLDINAYDSFVGQCSLGKMKKKRVEQLGVQVALYNQTTVPVISKSGIPMQPGIYHQLKIERQYIERVPLESGGSCQSKYALNHFDPEEQSTFEYCRLDALLTAVEKGCNCSLRVREIEDDQHNHQPCNVADMLTCIDKFAYASTSHCRPSCEEHVFTATEFSARLPENLLDFDEFEGAEGESEMEECPDRLILGKEEVQTMKKRFFKANQDRINKSPDLIALSMSGIGNALAAFFQIGMLSFDPIFENATVLYDVLMAKVPCLSEINKNFSSILQHLEDQYGETNQLDMFTDKNLTVEILSYLTNTSVEEFDESQMIPLLIKNMSEVKKLLTFMNGFAKATKSLSDRVSRKFYDVSFPSLDETFKGNKRTTKGTIFNFVKMFAKGSNLTEAVKSLEKGTSPFKSDALREYLMNLMTPNGNKGNAGQSIEGLVTSVIFPRMKKDIQYLVQSNDEYTLSINLVQKFAIHEVLHSIERINKSRKEKMVALLLTGSTSLEQRQRAENFVVQLSICTAGPLSEALTALVNEFQAAYFNMKDVMAEAVDSLSVFHQMYKWDKKFVQRNIMMFNIYYDQLATRKVLQESAYSIWSMLCDFGGTLGLFLGISVLTIFEAGHIIINNVFGGTQAQAQANV